MDLADLIGQLKELSAKSVVADVAVLDDDQLLWLTSQLESCRQQVGLAVAHGLAELDVRGTTDSQLGRRTGNWLAETSRQAAGACRTRVRVATKLAAWFPLIDQALGSGALSWSHAEALCRVANPRIIDTLAELSEHLIELAQHCTFERWAKEIQGIAERLDTEGGHRPQDIVNRLRFDRGIYGTGQLTGEFNDVDAAAIAGILGARANDILHRLKNDPAAPDGLDQSQLWAMALVEILNGEPADQPDLSGPIRPIRPPRADLTVIHHHGSREFSDANGNALPDTAELRARLCDCNITHVEVDHHGVPLRVGRTRRQASAAIRRALVARDGGCVFPGCERPVEHCDAHHIAAWQHGGRTDLDNMALLCRYHHGVTHRRGWQMEPDPDHTQRFRWRTPTGDVLRSQRHQRDARSGFRRC
jgi:hypothetical protein